mgnify:CR=1 FL=1
MTDLIIQAGGLVWSRPGLSPDKRSLTTISALIAQGHLGPLREHIEIGLGNGLSQTEITEAIIQCAIYAGFPRTVAAMEVAAEVFEALERLALGQSQVADAPSTRAAPPEKNVKGLR